ncbi:MAG TPA: hypothetical protein VI078_04885 [bacterium]
MAVRILALGDEGRRVLPSLERAVRAAWRTAGDVDLAVDCAGDGAPGARRVLARWCDRDRADVVLTVGRAGHLREDYAPGITEGLIERRLPGIEERMCLAPPARPEDLLFRGRAGLRKATLLVNLPARAARAAAIVRFLAPVLGHALDKARGDGAECGRPEGAR